MKFTFRDDIIRIRKALGLSQQQVAEKAFLTQHAISQYETGAREMSLTMFNHLLSALGLTFSYTYLNHEGENILMNKIQNESPKEPIDFRSIRNEEGFRLWVLQRGTETVQVDINDDHFIVFPRTEEASEGALFWLDLSVYDRNKLVRICIEEDIAYEEI